MQSDKDIAPVVDSQNFLLDDESFFDSDLNNADKVKMEWTRV